MDRGAPGSDGARLCLATRPQNRAALRIGQRRQDRRGHLDGFISALLELLAFFLFANL